MTNEYGAEYYHKDHSPILEETAQAAIRYIFEGDDLYALYDLQGLTVFAVIAALRENDESLYGGKAKLTAAQLARLEVIESEVDASVKEGLHYYPWGDKQNKRNLDRRDHYQLSTGERSGGVVNGLAGRATDKKHRRKAAQRKAREENTEIPVFPVVVHTEEA